jgi:hypothetical protein
MEFVSGSTTSSIERDAGRTSRRDLSAGTVRPRPDLPIASSTASSVVLYSDGIAGHRNDAGDLFGTETIARTLMACGTATAAGTVRALQDAVLSFSRRPSRDDATILLVHTLPEP